MPNGKTKAFATRIPADEALRIERAVEETDWTKSELLRRALRYYEKRNPDDILAFHPEFSVERMLEDLQ